MCPVLINIHMTICIIRTTVDLCVRGKKKKYFSTLSMCPVLINIHMTICIVRTVDLCVIRSPPPKTKTKTKKIFPYLRDKVITKQMLATYFVICAVHVGQ